MLNKKRVVRDVDFSDEKFFVRSISKGDRNAFQFLYDSYSGLFYSIAMRYSESTQEAEDYVQDAFIQIHKKASSFSHKGSFEGWMKRVLVNTCLSAIRKKKILFNNDEDDLQFFNHSENNWVIESMTSIEIIESIKELPMGCRTVLNMNVMEGYDHKEIGNQLGISESASRS